MMVLPKATGHAWGPPTAERSAYDGLESSHRVGGSTDRNPLGKIGMQVPEGDRDLELGGCWKWKQENGKIGSGLVTWATRGVDEEVRPVAGAVAQLSPKTETGK
ncbi:hypothetical protein VTN77DRAFT_4815 [Rasamsonia byssochlamydoides]|uniref:uncharacterized protein n=1 Tax=Rasamsonia byssochlamydoides TaxID=89139 RepID=UPI0037433197